MAAIYGGYSSQDYLGLQSRSMQEQMNQAIRDMSQRQQLSNAVRGMSQLTNPTQSMASSLSGLTAQQQKDILAKLTNQTATAVRNAQNPQPPGAKTMSLQQGDIVRMKDILGSMQGGYPPPIERITRERWEGKVGRYNPVAELWQVSFVDPSDPINGYTEHIMEVDLELVRAKGGSVKTKPKVNFDTVIIADDKREQILEALEQIHQTDLIFEDWGFGETIEKGRGVSMLFYGLPGTGKTLMGQAIANKLKSELVVISTADIESSAPGEAERNIRKHFKEAGEKKSVLLFDECDSLIYNRASVGAILGAQINELLSQIERFDGVTIFTTNRLGTLDEAFNRRLALKLEFAMPTAAERILIWQRMFPKKAPIAKDVVWDKLASVEVTGGYIKNSVLRAARMAAAEKLPNKKKKITMKHLVKALSLEATSMAEFEKARAKEQRGYGYGRNGVVRTQQRTIEKVAAA